MKNRFWLVLAVLAFSAWSAAAAPDLRGGKLEKLHDDSGRKFGEYGVSRDGSGVLGGSGKSAGLKFSRSTHRASSGQADVPKAGSGGSGAASGDPWRVRGGIAAIVAGVVLLGLVVPGILPVAAAAWGAALIFGGIMALLYPWK